MHPTSVVLRPFVLFEIVYPTVPRGKSGKIDHDQRRFSGMWPRLLPFQREGVAFALSKEGRACICDEMGLGKTLQVWPYVQLDCRATAENC